MFACQITSISLVLLPFWSFALNVWVFLCLSSFMSGLLYCGLQDKSRFRLSVVGSKSRDQCQGQQYIAVMIQWWYVSHFSGRWYASGDCGESAVLLPDAQTSATGFNMFQDVSRVRSTWRWWHPAMQHLGGSDANGREAQGKDRPDSLAAQNKWLAASVWKWRI